MQVVSSKSELSKIGNPVVEKYFEQFFDSATEQGFSYTVNVIEATDDINNLPLNFTNYGFPPKEDNDPHWEDVFSIDDINGNSIYFEMLFLLGDNGDGFSLILKKDLCNSEDKNYEDISNLEDTIEQLCD
jgi:hypothetical protein